MSEPKALVTIAVLSDRTNITEKAILELIGQPAFSRISKLVVRNKVTSVDAEAFIKALKSKSFKEENGYANTVEFHDEIVKAYPDTRVTKTQIGAKLTSMHLHAVTGIIDVTLKGGNGNYRLYPIAATLKALKKYLVDRSGEVREKAVRTKIVKTKIAIDGLSQEITEVATPIGDLKAEIAELQLAVRSLEKRIEDLESAGEGNEEGNTYYKGNNQ